MKLHSGFFLIHQFTYCVSMDTSKNMNSEVWMNYEKVRPTYVECRAERGVECKV